MIRKVIIALFLILSVSIVSAQRLCEAIVDNALEQAGANCVEQDGEISCYAYDSLSSTFFSEDQVGTFITPGSVIGLETLHTVQSAELDLEEDEWGIAYLQARANLEEATAESSMRVIMLGDVFMENAVEGASTSTETVATVFITIAEATPLRDSPSDTGAEVGSGTSAMVLEADAINADGTWVRATLDGQIVWVARASLFPNDAIDNLAAADGGDANPSAGGNTSAFGSLYFSTGDDSDCQEAPNMLVVQGPNEQSVDVTINDVPVRIGSTIGLGLSADGDNDVMWITVISGNATLYPDTPEAVNIPEGHFAEATISAEVGSGTIAVLDAVTGQPIMSADGIPYVRRAPTTLFTAPAPLSEDGTGYKNPNYYSTVRRLPDTMLNYALGDTGSETVTETICTLTPIAGIGAVNAHIGPGRGRSVRTIYEETDVITNASEVTAEDGSLWYEVETEAFGLVYVAAEDFTENCETSTRTVRTECILEVKSDVTELWGHVGPGYNRNVTNFLDITLTYEPIGRVDVEGVPWFEVPFSDTVTVWVDGEQFVDLEGCSLEELEATPPPIVVPVESNTATPAPQSTREGVPTEVPSGGETVPTVAPAVATQEPTAPVVTEQPVFTDEPAFTEEPFSGPEPQSFTVSFSGCNGGNGDGTETMGLIADPPLSTDYVVLSSFHSIPYTGGTIFADLYPEDQPITYVDAYDVNSNYLGSATGLSYSC